VPGLSEERPLTPVLLRLLAVAALLAACGAAPAGHGSAAPTDVNEGASAREPQAPANEPPAHPDVAQTIQVAPTQKSPVPPPKPGKTGCVHPTAAFELATALRRANADAYAAAWRAAGFENARGPGHKPHVTTPVPADRRILIGTTDPARLYPGTGVGTVLVRKDGIVYKADAKPRERTIPMRVCGPPPPGRGAAIPPSEPIYAPLDDDERFGGTVLFEIDVWSVVIEYEKPYPPGPPPP